MGTYPVRRQSNGRYTFKTRLWFAWRKFIYRVQRTIVIGGKLTVVAWLMVGSLEYGIAYAKGNQVMYIAPMAFAAEVPQTIPPILEKIAKAESGDSQVGTTGQTIIHVNTNGTYDTGKYQINSIWNALATKLGYNLMIEKDNEAFALYLFNNYGSEPWSSSKARWDK